MKVINIAYTEIVNTTRTKNFNNKVLHEFAKRLNVTAMQIKESNKCPHMSDIRQLYCKLRYERHGVNYSVIGREIGRSPATVKYSVEHINDLLHYKDKKLLALWNKVKDISGLNM